MTLAALGVESITLVLKSFDTDELTFVIKKQDAFAAATYVYGDSVALLDPYGVTRFQGRIRNDVTTADAQSERITYTAWNCWDDLKTTVYQQRRAFTSTTDWVTLSDTPTTAVVLFRNPAYPSVGGWQPWTVEQLINDVITFAIANGVSMLADLSGISGANDQQSPWSEATDITCAAVLRRCQSPMADLSGYFDYTTTPPTLRCVRRASMFSNGLTLTDATQVLKIDRLRLRSDMVPTGVVFLFITSANNPLTGKSYDVITASTAGAISGPRCIINTINLTQLENDSAFYTAPLASKIVNMAQDYYNTLLTPWFEGQVTIKQQECSNVWHAGMLAEFTGGRADWATANGVVQLVSQELMTGLTTLRFGPPAMLGIADWLKTALAGTILRQSSPPATGCGSSSSDGTSNVTGGMTPQKMTLCGGGTVTVMVQGG